MVVLTPACAIASAVDILGLLLAVVARFGSCGPAQERAFAEVRCGCVKAMCTVLGRFGCFSAPRPRGCGHGLGPTAHPGEHQVSGGECRATRHRKVCILPGLSRGLLLGREGGIAMCQRDPASKGESDHGQPRVVNVPLTTR